MRGSARIGVCGWGAGVYQAQIAITKEEDVPISKKTFFFSETEAGAAAFSVQ